MREGVVDDPLFADLIGINGTRSGLIGLRFKNPDDNATVTILIDQEEARDILEALPLVLKELELLN